MDSVTQAVLGASLQGALLGRTQGRRALAYGAALATLPDLDVVIRYADPVSRMTYHRGFSHSIFVLTALAALLTWLIRKRWPEAPYTAQRLFITLWLVLVTHPVLDSFTVYGTQLFWPLTLTPESWSAVFIIDPVYTVPLLVGVLLAAIWGPTGARTRWLTGVLVFSTAYLLVAFGTGKVMEHRARTALAAQGIEVKRVRSTPMPFNTLVWRVFADTTQGDYLELVSSVFDRDPPETLRQSRNLPFAAALADSPLHARLRWFTDDWLRYDRVGNALVVSDLRMGVAGSYTFRFKMAECTREGQWVPVTPSDWPAASAGLPEIKQVLKRIVSQNPPLPMGDWVDRFLDAQVRQNRALAPSPACA